MVNTDYVICPDCGWSGWERELEKDEGTASCPICWKEIVLEGTVFSRIFGDTNQMAQPASQTTCFRFYFLAVSAFLFWSGMWVATSGEVSLLWGATPLGAVLVASTMTFFTWIPLIKNKYVIILFVVSISYTILAVIGRGIIPKEGFDQIAFVGLALIQGGALGLLLAVFSQPMLPPELSNTRISSSADRRDALNLHLSNQWRVGQIALTVTVLTIGGLLVWTFPQGGSAMARERMTVTGLPFVFVLGPVLLYVLRKIFLIEQEVMDSFTKE